MRKHYFNNAETGFFKKVKRKVVPKNPMTGVVVHSQQVALPKVCKICVTGDETIEV